MKISEAEKKAVVVDTDSIPVGAANSPKAYRFTMQQVKQYANDGMASKQEVKEVSNKAASAEQAAALAEGKVLEALRAAVAAQQAASVVDEAVQNLPDGSAYAVQITNVRRDTTYLLHLFGQYATPDPQSLAIDPTRKDVAISAESMSEVAAQGWAISQPIVIKKGNIYRIKVGEASGQYVTTAMRYQYRDEQGNLRYAYKRKTQLDEHSELPIDGYLIMYGLPRDYELVVCFKYTAQYDPVVEVLTAGLLRTLAFQLGDMQDMIDQKLDVNGHSSAASVGGAMALLQKGDVPEDTYSELLTARMIGNAPDLMHVHGGTDTRTGIDDGKDVNVVVEKVWGDVIGGNQMVKNPTFENNFNGWLVRKQYVDNGDHYEFSSIDGSIWLFQEQPFVVGHTYIAFIQVKYNVNEGSGGLLFVNNQGKHVSFKTEWQTAFSLVKANSDNRNFGLSCYPVPVDGKVKIKKETGLTLLDLTLLFPTDTSFVDSLTADDAIKVAHRLGFSAFTLD